MRLPTLSYDRLYKDDQGRITLWQTPNVPLTGWIVCKLITLFIGPSSLQKGFVMLGTAFIFTWAFLELTKGANYIRSLLGLIVLIVTVIGFFKI